MPKVNTPDVKIKYIHTLAKMKKRKIFGSASGAESKKVKGTVFLFTLPKFTARS